MKTSPVALAATLAALVAACDPIVSGSYRGEPLYVIDGWVQLSVSPETLLGAAGDDGPELRVAVLWSQTKGSSFELEGAVEQEVVTTGSFPARFSVTLYEPPAADVLRAVPDAASGGTGEVAIAAIVAYVDSDDDATWDRDSEELVGGADERLFLYTPDGIASAVLGTWPAGFHTLVPTTECTSPLEDLTATTLRYSEDTSGSIDLAVDGNFPVSALFDVDCDPDTFDWGGTCPPLDRVREECREEEWEDELEAAEDGAMCAQCEDRLWPTSAEGDFEACSGWFDACLFEAPPGECSRELYACLGAEGPPPHHCDLRCACDHLEDECLEDGGGHDDCAALRYDCLER